MQQALTKKDLEAIQRIVDVSVQGHVAQAKDSLRAEINGLDAKLTESIRDLKQYVDATQANLRREIRQDLSEAHEELVEAIQEVIVKKEIVVLKAELQKIDARLTVLEAR